MEHIVNTLVSYIWGSALVGLALGVGLYFTILTKGVQFRYLFEMFKLLKEQQSSEEGVSPFQAFCLSLSGRVGIGTIAGVATAIAAGGPGAIFWMNVTGILGASSAFIESTLAQVYKHRADGQYRGGGPYYIERGLGLKKFAIFVAAVIFISYGILVPGIQANTISESFQAAFNIPPFITGIIVVVLMAFLIFGGIKRLASTADKVIPFMTLAYILIMFAILGSHYKEVPQMFGLIIKSAFGLDAMYGGIVGYAVSWGVRRAIFSTVAGAGESTFSSAAAEVSHPVKQGLIQACSVYITIIICTASGLMMLITNMYNVFPNGSDIALIEHIPGVGAGSVWTQKAISTLLPNAGASFTAIAIFLFAFTTLMAYYYIAETTIVFLDRKLSYPILKLIFKIIFLIVIFVGSVQSVRLMWGLGDIGFGCMSYLNFFAILLLSKTAILTLKDYEQQKNSGLDPIFDPRTMGIKNADFWEEYSNKYTQKKYLISEHDEGEEESFFLTSDFQKIENTES